MAATASRPASAAVGAVVSAGPEPMTGQGQSAPSASTWGALFRHVRYENLVAGVSGGVLSNLALHPLDLVKIRFAGEPSLAARPPERALGRGLPGRSQSMAEGKGLPRPRDTLGQPRARVARRPAVVGRVRMGFS